MALARLHLAAADFGWPACPAAVLMKSRQATIGAADPPAAANRLVAARPGLAAYLAGRRWPADFEAYLAPLIPGAAPLLAALRPHGHGHWHPSNLTWTSAAPDARVAGIFDFGLANRTYPVHDLALALERAVVSWLDLPETGAATADLAVAAVVLDGYQTVRPLSDAEAAALTPPWPMST